MALILPLDPQMKRPRTGQCSELWYPEKFGHGYYCVLDVGHKGPHETSDGRHFPQREEKKL